MLYDRIVNSLNTFYKCVLRNLFVVIILFITPISLYTSYLVYSKNKQDGEVVNGVDTMYTIDAEHFRRVEEDVVDEPPLPKDDAVDGSGGTEVEIVKRSESFVDFSDLPFSPDNLKKCIEYYEIDCGDWVYAQAVLETGNFTSGQFKKKNNLFGLYNSSKRSYFSFGHWSLSVKAYKNMIQREGRYNEKKYNSDNYGEYLRKIGYAEDKSYIVKLQKIRRGIPKR